MLDSIYLHIDTTSNAVLSKGITNGDFSRSIVHIPKNILLLDPSQEIGEYEVHTGMRVIRGDEEVQKYFKTTPRRKQNEEIKWIDFSDEALLKELTPLEISELLYFGHMKIQLHSPFFYKLQNNFVFFEFMDNMSRIYYRYLDEFYRVLGEKIRHILDEKLNERKTFFRRGLTIEPLDIDLLKELKPILQEGVVLGFEQQELIGKEYRIPIHIIEDSLWKMKNKRYLTEPLIATLTYHAGAKKWELETTDDLLLNTLPRHA